MTMARRVAKVTPDMNTGRDMKKITGLLHGYRATCLLLASVQLGLPGQLAGKRVGEASLARALKARFRSRPRSVL